MLTRRGFGVLLLAATAYLGGRLVGTYELFLAAVALAILALISLATVLISGSRIVVTRTLYPPTPTAGDPAVMQVRVRNDALLPSAPLQIIQDLRRMTGADAVLELSPRPPRSVSAAEQPLPPLRRGVFTLPAPTLWLSDPLGLARRRRAAGPELTVTVPPGIAELRSCVFFGSRAAARTRVTRPSLGPAALAPAAVDLRGVRPHQPGEPLSRIDWKSTAKTGALMLREVEERTRAGVVLLVDGTRATQVGEPPDDSFETVISAAGSIGAYVLREGLPLHLVRHWGPHDSVFLDPRGRGREELLGALAGAAADAPVFLSECLDRHHALLTKGKALVIVSPACDRGLLGKLVGLRQKGLPVFLVHVDGPSFALPAGATAATDEKRFLLQLQAAGVLNVSIRRGDDLGRVLSFPLGESERQPASARRPAQTAAGPGRAGTRW
ncbi:MAG: hypothetical protein Kow00122_18360 [Thermoleophilia bacterium]